MVIVLGLGLTFNVNAKTYGEGEVQLSKRSVEHFIKYIRGKKNEAPQNFYITLDGSYSTYWYCKTGNCTANVGKEISACKKSAGKMCKLFAKGRYVKWKNGINPGKGKASKISSKWTDAQIYAKLTELGFLESRDDKVAKEKRIAIAMEKVKKRKEVNAKAQKLAEEKAAKDKKLAEQKIEEKNEIANGWMATVKHPRSKIRFFIATDLSTKKEAIDLAMKRCYVFVSQSLQKKGYNECFLSNVYNTNNNQTEIAKIETNEEKVVKEKKKTITTYDWVAVTKHPLSNKDFIATELSTEKKAIDLAMKKCYTFVSQSLQKKGYNDCSLSKAYNINKTQTEIAKVEGSHLMKPNEWIYFIPVTKKYTGLAETSGYNQWDDTPDGIRVTKFDASHFLNNKKNMKSYKFNTSDKLFIYERKSGGILKKYIRISEKLYNLLFYKSVKTSSGAEKLYSKLEDYKPKILNELIDEYTDNQKLKNKLVAHFDTKKIDQNQQIAKAETTVKPKKKTKVAKVEPKQEEFKPKKTNQDNEAPVIQIAEAITVNDASYEIEGSVTDKSDKIFVQINGRNVTVVKGKFKMKRFSPVDEEIQIIATDQWGNTSKPKIVSVIIDQKDNDVATVLETLDPSKIRSKSNKNKVALIIGIEKYDQTPEASYANLDAQYFYEYAKKGFGISKSNIKLLVDEDANLIKSLGTLNKWLPGKIKSGETELIIFFAGHGLASNDGKELYLLPQDSDPDLLARTALSRTELFKQIISLNPKNVTIFLDTCYSGVSRDEKTLLASARPVRIVADKQDTPNNFTIFSASQLDQISSGLKEAKHGIFSYYLMKGLEGNADANNDKDITNGELLAYMDQNVAQKASELGRQQNPSLAGDPDKILMSYR